MERKPDSRRTELAGIAEVHRQQVARAVLEAALDAIIVMGSNGAVIEWNPAAEELFGWDRDETIGKQLADLIIPDELRDSHRTGMAHYLDTGEGPALNTRLTLPALRRDGSQFTVELTISPSSSREGPVFTGWLRDITELVEARDAVARSEERLASLLANVSDVITVMEEDGSWVSSSGAGTRLLGYEAGFEPDGGIFSLVHPDDIEVAQTAFAEVVAGTRTAANPIDLRVQAKNGDWHVLETVAENLIDDPSVNGLVLTSRDVTQARARATEVHELSSQRARWLESERDLREKAEDQAQALREIADLKTELVAMVSHELRTPLTSIVSFADLMLAEDHPPSPDEQHEFISIIDRNAKRLIRLVDDLLLLGQLESGVTTIDTTMCRAGELVEWAVSSAAQKASAADIRITTTVEPGPPLQADQGRIGQVLDNLVSNAVKFSDAGSSVELVAEHTTGSGWTFAVADDGPGIPEAEQPQLFESFFRGSRTAQSTPGTGLGLAISKAIVDLHGGTIGVESTEGSGSRFWFVIPDDQVEEGVEA